MITFPDDVKAAYSRSKNIIRKTPLDHSPALSNIIDGDVYLKLDNKDFAGDLTAFVCSIFNVITKFNVANPFKAFVIV